MGKGYVGPPSKIIWGGGGGGGGRPPPSRPPSSYAYEIREGNRDNLDKLGGGAGLPLPAPPCSYAYEIREGNRDNLDKHVLAIFLHKTHFVTVLMRGHNICFC